MSRKTAAVTQTLMKYSEETSVHGIGYVFNKSQPLSDRIIWFLSVVLFLTFACFFVLLAYNQWQDSPTITNLEKTTKDVTELEFPGVTICASGLNMKAVRKVIEKDFEGWESTTEFGVPTRRKRETRRKPTLEETFGTNNLDLLMDIVQSMFYRDVPKDIEVLSVMRYLRDSASGIDKLFHKFYSIYCHSTSQVKIQAEFG